MICQLPFASKEAALDFARTLPPECNCVLVGTTLQFWDRRGLDRPSSDESLCRTAVGEQLGLAHAATGAAKPEGHDHTPRGA